VAFLVSLYCSAPVNRLFTLSNDVIASGDDQGCIKIWDTRQHRCVVEWKEHVDYISGFAANASVDHLLATGGDGRLSAYDLRKNVLAGKSDELEDELLSVIVLKNGKKVVCGSQDGVLVVFSWGTWGDMSDRFPGHPESIDTIVKIDEDTVLTGSSDGIVRCVGSSVTY
jgi:WD repeat-containing protein 55